MAAQDAGHDQSAQKRDESMAQLVKELSHEAATLVREEVALAKAEMTEKGKQAGLGLGMFGGSGLFAVFSFGALTTCLIAALNTFMALWLGALIVAVVYAAVAGALAMTGKQEVKQAKPPVPEQTKQTLKEDMQWAKHQATSAKR